MSFLRTPSSGLQGSISLEKLKFKLFKYNEQDPWGA